MINIVLWAVLGLLVLSVALQCILLLRKAVIDFRPIEESLRLLAAAYERTERLVRDEIANNREEAAKAALQSRQELAGGLKAGGDTLNQQINHLIQTNDQKFANFTAVMESLRGVVETRLKTIQEDNARQLDRMRATVDEKLQGTLEKRLGESFKLVSDRLEQVYRGLGEMQTLATGVGDLKKVLTNVKNRGTWGEVQLGAMLEQVLSPEQYATNVATKEGGERVEFAIKLPGRGEGKEQVVWLPIDAKFPTEDYQRLLEAQEKSDAAAAEQAGKQLEARIKQCAWDICEKYIAPPRTTDFGILFLPTEGLFAEAVRRIGLPDYIQRECRVVLAGPTTLWALLNSLQMGFRTLAIEKRSSEVWTVLGAVKTEFGRFGDLLEGVEKKLDQAANNIKDAARKSRTIERKLRGVQELPVAEAAVVLELESHATENGDNGQDQEG
jgi:DNA recombination protein RmuC